MSRFTTLYAPKQGIGYRQKSVHRTRSHRMKFWVQRGDWGRCPQQADGRKCECVLTLALLAGFVCGYPHALLAGFVCGYPHALLARQYASLQNVALKNYAISVFYSYDYVKTGLNFILISDKMILMNGGVSLERSGRKIAVSAGKC